MIARLEDATKVYRVGDQEIVALDRTTLEVRAGELLLIIGPSGSGKTTLLSLIGCLINPSAGRLEIEGRDVSRLSEKELAGIRLNTIGFVFQQFNLLAPLTAEENVAWPLKMQKRSAAEIRQRTDEALDKVQMMARRKNLPRQLSGGQQQRIAIARALVTDPKLILCDEPTASLDRDSVDIVMNELRQLARSGKSVAVVTHDQRLYTYADRAVEVKNGQVTPINLDDVQTH
jgi:putative ABC transport system ATP-binding protein